jgi:hypothetical protein
MWLLTVRGATYTHEKGCMMESNLRRYGDNFIPVIPVERLYHTKERPFCDDLDCPCHTDEQTTRQFKEQYDDGLLTAEEVDMTIKGKIL